MEVTVQIVRNPVGRVIGYGSTGEGLRHWVHERVTALALTPLGIWFVIAVIGLADESYEGVRTWLAAPWNTALMLLTVILSFWHAKLGMQVVIEDYVHGENSKTLALLANLFIMTLFGTVCAVAVLKVSLGS
jgi:succinate dehydrogenase / fumarate reductase membrane anchor subunit